MKAARADEIIRNLSRDGFAVAAMDGKKHEIFPVAIDPREGEALQRWITKEKPSSVIDIGLGYGVAAINAIKVLQETHDENFSFYTIDPNQKKRFSNLGRQFIEEAGATGQTEFSDLPSEFVLPELQQRGRSFDFAIVDGNHRFDGVFIDLFYLNRLVKPGGVIFLDDYQLPGIRKAAGFFIANLEWETEEVSEEDDLHQWAVLRTRKEPLERDFKYFVDF